MRKSVFQVCAILSIISSGFVGCYNQTDGLAMIGVAAVYALLSVGEQSK